MRLTSKYTAEGVLRRYAEHLRDIFPISPSIDHYDAALPRRFLLSPAEVMMLANAVQELQVSRIVASLAFTCALDMSPETIMEGTTIGEGIVELSPRMKRNALKVRAGVVQLLDDFLSRWMIITSSTCTQKDICLIYSRATKPVLLSSDCNWSARVNLPPYKANERLAGSNVCLYQDDTWHWLPLARPDVYVANSYCEPCKGAFREEYTALRDSIWRSVPGWVGDTPDWVSGNEV
jgi:hypothetical protein